MPRLRLSAALALVLALLGHARSFGQLTDPQTLLDRQSFWDNRDWDWYKANIPFLETPDPDIDTTYYYRWELVTKHLTYGSPRTGYVFTEFIDRPFWSGRYGAISCPAGHQLAEVRWLRDPRYAREYARYWFQTPGAEPRRYSCWLADAVWGVHRVHPDRDFVRSLLPGLKANYEGWVRERFEPTVGMFWQTGHDDGMEININSRQTADPVRGAPAYRPTLNAYLHADALAIARAAELVNDAGTAKTYRERAAALKSNLQAKLWDPKRSFFFPMARRDETRDGFTVKAGSLTYQTGRYAGDRHGRELIGYVPWQFDLPDAGKGYEAAWSNLMDPDGFFAPFGPTVTERNDPQFQIAETCCVWSGQSWPYATSQTLTALANLLHRGGDAPVTRDDYVRLLRVYAKTHRKGDRPYLAEGCNPDTGSWQGYDAYNHSEHYFHSSYVDLIVTGLIGLRPRDDDTLELHPLVPDDWAFFSLRDVPYRGHRVTVLFDRDGTKFGQGKGLQVLLDGRPLAHEYRQGRLTAALPPSDAAQRPGAEPAASVNLAVNNDGGYYPRVTTSYACPTFPPSKLIDGNFWYHVAPPNRWTFEDSPHEEDWVAVDFGTARRVDTVKLYFLDDGEQAPVRAPASVRLEFWDGRGWEPFPRRGGREPASVTKPQGHRATVVEVEPMAVSRVRAVVTHGPGSRAGLSEFECWGDGRQSVADVPPPAGNLAYNPGNRPFPKASASYTSRFDRVERANDGVIQFNPNPANRWTTYESPNKADWLEIDLGRPQKVGRVELALYDDRGGVRPPADYEVHYLDPAADDWIPVPGMSRTPSVPAGGQFNEVRFRPVTAARIRVLFRHNGTARCGVTEFLVWPE